MPKNILIFSDGTGQAGGISFDERRSNIYKLYRATRVGPDYDEPFAPDGMTSEFLKSKNIKSSCSH
jgi:Uncharacterized alpha/beta hydrolase domain (DUF2235)